MSGSATETYSEVLAQVCLAYSIAENKALTLDELVSGNELDPKVMNKINRYIITPPSVNLLAKRISGSGLSYSGFVTYIKGNVSGKLNWVDAQGRNMQEVKEDSRLPPDIKFLMINYFQARQHQTIHMPHSSRLLAVH